MAEPEGRIERVEIGPPRPAVRSAHRLLGLCGVLFLILLILTGLLLQHPDLAGLDARYVKSRAVLNWYGISAPDASVTYRYGPSEYTQLRDQIYRDQQPLPDVVGELKGVTGLTDVTLLATDQALWLYTGDGRLIERVTPPEPPLAIGTTSNRFALRTERGVYTSDTQMLEWQSLSPALTSLTSALQWAAPGELNAEHLADLQAAFLDRVLTWERVMIDLHSGRLFGSAGTYIIDAAALILLIIAISGLLLASRPPRPPRPPAP